MSDLSFSIGPLRFPNPVVLASGTAGYGYELEPYIDLDLLGGFITKGIYPAPRAGNPSPRVYETPSGMLNAIGLQGIGMVRFRDEVLPFWERYKPPLGINVAGECPEDYARVVEYLDSHPRIDFYEINLSCPNVQTGGRSPSWFPEETKRILSTLRPLTKRPLIAKLSPHARSVEEIAFAAQEAGADGVSLISTFIGLAVDLKSRRPILHNLFGGVSGPAVKPMALAMVYKVFQRVSLPILGMGGIVSGRDLLEFIVAGASGVQIGTATIVDPQAPLRILREASELLPSLGCDSLGELRGSLKPYR